MYESRSAGRRESSSNQSRLRASSGARFARKREEDFRAERNPARGSAFLGDPGLAGATVGRGDGGGGGGGGGHRRWRGRHFFVERLANAQLAITTTGGAAATASRDHGPLGVGGEAVHP
jgi:hypothetical protein